jgi:hypothetical protein
MFASIGATFMEFMLIDLDQQLEAVNCYLLDYPQNDIVTWMKQFGDVKGPIDSADFKGVEFWSFRSSSGRVTVFWFDEKRIVIPGRRSRDFECR